MTPTALVYKEQERIFAIGRQQVLADGRCTLRNPMRLQRVEVSVFTHVNAARLLIEAER